MGDKDERFNIKPFTVKMNIYWSEHWISNGHFLIKKDLVKLGDRLTSTDALVVAFPSAVMTTEKTDADLLARAHPKKRQLRIFTRSSWGTDRSVMYVDAQGLVAWLDREYADAFDLSIVYGSKADAPFYNAHEFSAASIVIMAMTAYPAWSEMAKCLAQITPVEQEEGDETPEGEQGDVIAPADDDVATRSSTS